MLSINEIVCVLLLALSAFTAALPQACRDNMSEDDCMDAIMHPDMQTKPSLTERASTHDEYFNEYWLQKGRDFVRQQASAAPNTKVAKNIILFLGDGMGLTTFTAARNLLGGEEQQLSFERFPYTGLSKTYSVDKIVPDSACTSTAYLCGVKANYGTIGVNGQVQRGDCNAMRETSNHVQSIAKWALDAGKAAGFVTTTRVTHASPAGVYAHTADRLWENDAALKKDCSDGGNFTDIAQQLIMGDVGSRLKVMMGGGKSNLVGAKDYAFGWREDGRNLIEEYLAQSAQNAYVETRQQLLDLDLSQQTRLLGLFQNSHMKYHLDTLEDGENTQPTLQEMTKRAIEFMQNEEQGYFLFIEGGKIDIGHHATDARRALDETVEFSKAIELARNMTSEQETLIVVTADHSHTFSVGGYQYRGSDIFDVAYKSADDEKPYMSLTYANGAGFYNYFDVAAKIRLDPQQVLTQTETFPATVPLEAETHGGEDVAVFASGPWSHLFTGVYEQNAIPHMMAYAACVGEGLKAC